MPGAKLYQKFLSETFYERDRMMPLGVALIFGWMVAGAAFVTGMWVLPFNLAGGLLLLCATSLFVMRLYHHTCAMAASSGGSRFEVIITQSELVFFSYDDANDRHVVQSTLLRNVTVAEVFHYGELSMLTLITPAKNVEIPLSAFGSEADPMLRALHEWGVPIVSLHEEPLQIAA